MNYPNRGLARTVNRLHRARAGEWLESRRILAGLVLHEEPPVVASDAAGARDVRLADLDGDGDLDLVVASLYDNRVGWYENIATPTQFGRYHLLSDKAFGVAMAVPEDVDDDGDLDLLVVAGGVNRLYLLENLGSGNFSREQPISDSVFAGESVVAGDVDGDGDLDLVTTSSDIYDSDVSWFENLDGHGTFATQQLITAEVEQPTAAILADLDGDGDLDVASASYGDNKIAWYPNLDGAGTFGNPRVLSDLEGANELVAVDIDGDQDLDLVAGAFAYPSDLVWYENTNGQGNFASAQIIATGLNSVESIAIVDYDGDQDLDVVAHSVFDGVIFWCENTDGQGTFGEAQPILAGLSVSPSLAIGDIDGNGTLDIAYASLTQDYVGWFADARTSTAQPETISELGILGPDAVATFDADEDGDLDAVVAAVEDNAIVWFENVDGDGSFSEGILVDVLAGAIYVTPADFNADGRDDILAVGAAGTLAWYENLPGADFGPRQMLSDSLQGSEFATAMDVDGDGDFDVIATVNYEPNAQIVWYENTDGQGTFGGAHIVDEQLTSPREVAVADFDQDNDLDFAVASLFDNQIVIFTNEDGKGQFEIAQVIPTTQDIPVDVEAGDIDGDGDIDLTFMEFSGNSAAWIANDGSGTFGEPTTI
ncbi:MAG: VCBS repeat-containing protein, partial [Planctomycetales bacterium]|nr:VCBS repeat-containing protein [Planctomycetales bacterium]